jgi:hypothetical protein
MKYSLNLIKRSNDIHVVTLRSRVSETLDVVCFNGSGFLLFLLSVLVFFPKPRLAFDDAEIAERFDEDVSLGHFPSFVVLLSSLFLSLLFVFVAD